MSAYQEHIEQAKHNLELLAFLEKSASYNFTDWKITVCFYVALHLAHAYIVSFQEKISAHSHEALMQAINPDNRKPCAFSRKAFEAYVRL